VLTLLDHHLLDLGGTYGYPQAGDRSSTTSYASSKTQGDVGIVVYNPPSRLDVRAEAVRRSRGALNNACGRPT